MGSSGQSSEQFAAANSHEMTATSTTPSNNSISLSFPQGSVTSSSTNYEGILGISVREMNASLLMAAESIEKLRVALQNRKKPQEVTLMTEMTEPLEIWGWGG